jgi:hypothetical protein
MLEPCLILCLLACLPANLSAFEMSAHSFMSCSQIMGRGESEDLSAAQIMYPVMQCADIFFLKVCELHRELTGWWGCCHHRVCSLTSQMHVLIDKSAFRQGAHAAFGPQLCSPQGALHTTCPALCVSPAS